MTFREKKLLNEITSYSETLSSAEEPEENTLGWEFADLWYSLYVQRLINSACGLDLLCRSKYESDYDIMELIRFCDNKHKYIPRKCTRAEAIPKVKQINNYLTKKIKPIVLVALNMDKEAV